jgi:Fic family protein
MRNRKILSAKNPQYTLSDKMISLVAEITEIATHLEMRESAIDPLLRKKNRLKTIHSSLAIEQNTLTLKQVTDIIEGKRVFGPPKEIEEVKNAKAAYGMLEKVDPYSMKDFLKIHGLMVGGLTSQAGRFRTVEVGVYSGKKLVHAGVPYKIVPKKVKDLFAWVKELSVHPLISSCVFHYNLEYIHPFTDGNGRMGRYWQTVLLASWRAQMAWVPVEEIVRDRQDSYYQAISNADKTGDARAFIEFMLVALRDALMVVKKSVGKGVVKSVGKILALLKEYPEITRERLAEEVGLSVRGVEKNLAQLKSVGKIRRVGGRKSGRWEVVN